MKQQQKNSKKIKVILVNGKPKLKNISDEVVKELVATLELLFEQELEANKDLKILGS